MIYTTLYVGTHKTVLSKFDGKGTVCDHYMDIVNHLPTYYNDGITSKTP